MPEREDDHLTPATRLLEKRREMQEVEQALAAQKEVAYNDWDDFFIIQYEKNMHDSQISGQFINMYIPSSEF